MGVYYYRVRASAASIASPWSDVQAVAVTETPTGPLPGHYTGTPSLSFDVTAGGQVCSFDITVPFQSSTCHVQMSGCAPIVDNGFEFREEHPLYGCVKFFAGTFDTPSHATGDFRAVPPMSLAAIAAGADGLLIEVHPQPVEALCDGPQQLTPRRFERLMGEVRQVAEAVGRSA